MDNHPHYSPPDIPSHIAAASASVRRSSMHSHFTHRRGTPNPPLPHQAQAHFYGAPDIDFDAPQQSGIKAGEKGYYFGFDILPSLNTDRSAGGVNVAIAGYEGGLEVYSVGSRGTEHIASLKGLRGGVYHAKILPWTGQGAGVFPLVAVVVHGPKVPSSVPGINVEGDYDPVSADRSEAMATVTSDSNSRDGMGGARPAPGFVESYQTAVEVYSLKTGRLVSVLLEAPMIPLKTPITSPVFRPPPPTGALQIHAGGANIVVSSGITGECWVYRQAPAVRDDLPHFRCHGKVWTTVQQQPKGDTSPELDRSRPAPARPRPQTAIVSVSNQWMAYCPPAPSSQVSIRAMTPPYIPIYGRAPGLASMTAPQLPSVNADVDLPLSESVMNKLMRDATQELIQGAKWVSKASVQAWNNYWNPQSQAISRSPPAGPASWGAADAIQFPPTHGTVTPPVTKDPGLVSVLDLETVGLTTNVHPITTFNIPQGCSFLSLSPNGLSLFTASTKGDVQTVWDLMRNRHTRSSAAQATGASTSGGPRVRQVGQFSRMTVARIVDVAWTKPNGERLAMVTERGTVHLLDLPSSAFTWPPPRRRAPPQDAKAAEGPASAVAMASSALTQVREAARPLISRPRRSSSNGTGGGIGDYATHGGKMLAASISHSLSKTEDALNHFRQTGENRVTLPTSSSFPGPSCVSWISGKRGQFLFVLGGGLVRTFPAKRRGVARGGKKRAKRLVRHRDFKLASLPDNTIAPYVRSIVDPDEYLEFPERDMDAGSETMVLPHNRLRRRSHALGAEISIPQAEIESSAPYQPFQTDRRVALYLMDLSEDEESQDSGTAADRAEAGAPGSRKKGGKAAKEVKARSTGRSGDDGEAWTFGQPVRATKVDLGLRVPEEDSFSVGLEDSRALPSSAMERILLRTGDDVEQIVITTRRRRGANQAAGQDDDGFFEDDCDVLDFADQRV